MAFSNRIYSAWAEEKKKAEEFRLAHFSLQSLYKRPPPVWIHPTYLGAFGDAFVQGSSLEGGNLSATMGCFSFVLNDCLKVFSTPSRSSFIFLVSTGLPRFFFSRESASS